MGFPRGAGEAPDYWLTRFLVLRLLGLVYLVALLCLAAQLLPQLGARRSGGPPRGEGAPRLDREPRRGAAPAAARRARPAPDPALSRSRRRAGGVAGGR